MRLIYFSLKDPVFFNDTLRSNLDPFGEYSDYEIRNALNEVNNNVFAC
jgi:ABC-type multidrug transport system fused ATPase/permease subunit